MPFEYAEKTAAQIADELKELIVSLEYLPGSMISENELASRYLVSRTKIRAALSVLRSERYVVVVPQKGTFVNYLDADFIDDLMTLRLCAELKVFSELAQTVTPDQLSELKLQLDRQRMKMNEGVEYSEFEKYDELFHETCYKFAGRENMWQILSAYAPHIKRYRRLDKSKEPTVRLVFMEHCGIYEGLRSGSLEKAGGAAYKHLAEDYAKYKKDITEKFKDYFGK